MDAKDEQDELYLLPLTKEDYDADNIEALVDTIRAIITKYEKDGLGMKEGVPVATIIGLDDEEVTITILSAQSCAKLALSKANLKGRVDMKWSTRPSKLDPSFKTLVVDIKQRQCE